MANIQLVALTPNQKNLIIAAAVVIIALIIGFSFAVSRAASSFVSVEPEDAVISGNGVTVTGDAAASGGKYLQF